VYKETGTIIPAPNSRFTKAGGWCFYESEVLNSSFVHLMKFSAENPAFAKRQNVKLSKNLSLFLNTLVVNNLALIY
jgi:hypothetical protein